MAESFDFLIPTRLIFGPGSLARLGELAASLGFSRVLLVTDPGMVSLGYAARAERLLRATGIEVVPFHSFGENPDTEAVAAGRRTADEARVDSIVALGGGSSLDCAKGINFLLTGGGEMADYLGHGRLTARTTRPMLPAIGIPTTAGTGSEAQSYALISDSATHTKMACGDSQAAFRIALLDPELTMTLPRGLTAVTGYDAISHAVESFVTKKQTTISRLYAREAWRLLEANFERVLDHPNDPDARSGMLLGAFLAGVAIEASMLGATHSCANPLTKNHGTPHGEAIAVMLPHLVRWNSVVVDADYAELLAASGISAASGEAGDVLARRLESLRLAGSLPQNLGAVGVGPDDLPLLAAEAARQWTGKFNPREWSATAALEVYQQALL